MTEQELESGQAEGNEGTTNSNVSQGNGDERTSSLDAEKLLDELRATIKEEVGRTVQSTKDKRFSEIEKTLGDFQPVLERFKDLVSPEQLKEIQKDLEFEDLKRRVYGEKQTSEPASAGNTQAPAVDTAKTFAKVLDADMLKDPVVVLAMQAKFDSEDAAELAARRVQDRLSSSPAPSPAQGAPQAGKPTPPENIDELTDEYKQKMQAARGNRTAIQNLRSEYKQKGVDIYAVDFT